MADRPTTFDEIADRLIALESRGIVLKDLPLKQLMTKLQQDWDPDGTELVSDGTVKLPSLESTVQTAIGDPAKVTSTNPIPNGSLGTDWTAYTGLLGGAGPGIERDARRIVRLQGLVATLGTGTLILDSTNHGIAGPSGHQEFSALTSSGAHRIRVQTNGQVLIDTATALTWVSLSGISWHEGN